MYILHVEKLLLFICYYKETKGILNMRYRSNCVLRWISGITVCGAVMLLPSCSSHPNELEIGVDPTPLTPGIDIKYKRDTINTPLPPGWEPDGQKTIPITIDGKEYMVTLCIARKPDSDCIYITTGLCSSTEGWALYCPIEVVNDNDYMPADDISQPVITSFGTVSYNIISENIDAEFTTGTYTLVVDNDLLDTSISHPSTPGIYLGSSEFVLTYGNSMPEGSVVQFDGDIETTVWNAFLLGIEHFSFDATNGKTVAGVIIDGNATTPSIAVLVIDEQVDSIHIVFDPSR